MGLLIDNFRQCFDRVIYPRHNNGRFLLFHVFVSFFFFFFFFFFGFVLFFIIIIPHDVPVLAEGQAVPLLIKLEGSVRKYFFTEIIGNINVKAT